MNYKRLESNLMSKKESFKTIKNKDKNIFKFKLKNLTKKNKVKICNILSKR